MASDPETQPPFRAADILESITDAFFALDSAWRFTYVNDQAERVLLRTREELLGKSIWDEFPAAVGSKSQREYERAVDEQITVSFEDYYAPLATWFENHLFPSPEGLAVYFRDINDRKRTEEALRQSEERLRDAQTRLETALTAGGIATWAWDLVQERLVADANLARLFALSPEDAADGRRELYLQAIHPDDRPHVAQAMEDAVNQREVFDVEYRVALPGGAQRWLAARGRVERDAEGSAIALNGVVVDIAERVEREQRERFLAELAERARGLTNSDAVIADALHSVGEFLGVSRCVFVDIDIEADTCTCHPDYRADDSVQSMAGMFPISAFGPFVIAEYGAGREVVVDDVRLDPVRVPAGNLAAYEAVGIRAHAAVPVVHSARLVSCIGAHSAAPRRWKPEEVALLRSVVERTWLTVEVIRQDQALMRDAAATARILERVTDAFFALDTEWRFTYINRQAEAIWGRAGAEMLGKNVWDEFPEAVGSTFDRQFRRALAEGAAVPFEEYYPPLNAWLDVRVYPSADGLSVFFQNVNARKALEEERERLAERQRNIATQLQEALQPALPGTVPGLALTKYYEAALAEAGVGGDFYDVFAIEKGCTALVVGDLSGKGLAAAAQVSTVRNMLRAFLYSLPTVAEAVTELNRVLAENNLLSGFSTLFVGAYDSASGRLNYVNCGQEPALVRRAVTGATLPLEPTGPILGAIEGAQYVEGRAALAPGDAVAIFTDGLTEVGLSRTALLGLGGVAALLAEPLSADVGTAEQLAEALALRLIAGVNQFVRSGARDDMCLLVGVVP